MGAIASGRGQYDFLVLTSGVGLDGVYVSVGALLGAPLLLGVVHFVYVLVSLNQVDAELAERSLARIPKPAVHHA